MSRLTRNKSTRGAGGEFRQNWRALTAATIGISTGVAVLPLYTNGLFVPELEAEFGWTRSQLSLVPLVGSLIIVLTSPLVGAVVDRFGVRIPSGISLALLGVAYLALAHTGSSFLAYLAVFAAMYILGALSTAVAFTRVVAERFDRARGVALGISLSGAGLLAFLAPRLLGTLVSENWRAGYQIFGIVGLVSALSVVILLPKSSGTPHTVRVVEETGESLSHFVRQALFGRLGVAFAALALAVGGITTHMVPLLRDAGASASSAAATVSLIGIALIVGRIGVGLLVDRFFAPYVAGGVLLLAAGGYLALAVGGPGVAAAAAIGVGIALGAEVDLLGYLISRYYPQRHYGRLFGIFYAIFTVGLGLSPIMMAQLRSLTGSYTVALLVSVSLVIFSALLLVTAPRFPTAEPRTAHKNDTDPSVSVSSAPRA